MLKVTECVWSVEAAFRDLAPGRVTSTLPYTVLRRTCTMGSPQM